MEPRWLTDDELTAWLRLIALAELLPSRLDAQLRRDSALTHFEYQVLAMLSEAPERTLRMSWLAQRTQATLPRLSHVARRLEERGLLVRRPSQTDARATDATRAGRRSSRPPPVTCHSCAKRSSTRSPRSRSASCPTSARPSSTGSTRRGTSR